MRLGFRILGLQLWVWEEMGRGMMVRKVGDREIGEEKRRLWLRNRNLFFRGEKMIKWRLGGVCAHNGGNLIQKQKNKVI